MDNSDNQPGTSRASEKRSVSPSADTTTNSTTQQQNKRLKSDGVENEMVVGTTTISGGGSTYDVLSIEEITREMNERIENVSFNF